MPPNTIHPVPAPVSRSPGTVIARLTARKAIRSGLLWGYIFGVVVASSALSYATLYKTQAERNQLEAAFGSNNVTGALFGPGSQLQTVAGFTVYKSFMTLIILGAVWGLLTSTRLLRGEEDAGRWELLVSGQATGRSATAQALVGLAAGGVTLWAITALITAVSGRHSKVDIATGPALFFALALVASAVMFLAVGALTSQLAATRRQASAYAAVVLGISYAARMVADSGIGLHWLLWVSPLGWVEELRPLTAPQPLALIPIVVFTVMISAMAILLAGRRDLGASILPDRPAQTSRVLSPSGPLGLTVRMVRSTVIGWAVAIAASALLLGLVTKGASGAISGSSVNQVFTKLGSPGTGVDTYLGVAFLMVAVLIAFVANGQVIAARAEESGGRLDQLFARPLTRSQWFGGRLLVTVAVLLGCGVIAGLFTWLGAASQHAGVRFTSVMSAGLNIVPPAVCILGIGALVFGVWPRATSIAAYGVLGWSLLTEVVGGIGSLNHWVLDTSVFHQMAAAPAVAPSWTADAILVAIGVASALIGGIAFSRRDLASE
jgi:ABC-2 type transport system permease protein